MKSFTEKVFKKLDFVLLIGWFLGTFIASSIIVLLPALFVGTYYLIMWAITGISHIGKSFFIKGSGDFNFEWFPYWRVNLHIENDSSYQDWLNSPVKFINDNLQIINDFANDFEGGFLTRVTVLGIFLLPISIPMFIINICAMFFLRDEEHFQQQTK